MFQSFTYEILIVSSLLRQKLIFYCLKTTKISRSFKQSAYINFVLLINFPEQFELYFTSNVREVIKFYNLGNKSFETDFSFDLVGMLLPEATPIQIPGGTPSHLTYKGVPSENLNFTAKVSSTFCRSQKYRKRL